MTTVADFHAAMQAAYEHGSGLGKVQAFEQAVRLADELGDSRLQVESRIALSSAYYYVPSGAHQLTPFVWLLGAMDRGELTEQERHQTLWYAKWAMHWMRILPSIPLPVVLQTYEDIERRMVADGHSPNAFLQQRTTLSLEIEPPEVTRDWLARWRASARDSMSDCWSCEASSLADVLAELGDVQEALTVVEPVLQQPSSCAVEPESAWSSALPWFCETGDPQRAREGHLQTWRRVRTEDTLSSSRVEQLAFLARSGNEARALRFALQAAHHLDDLPAEGDRMRLAAVCSGILTRAIEKDLAPEQVRGIPTAELARQWHDEARQIASTFDARNGTDAISRQVTKLLELPPLAVTVDLSDLEPAPQPAAVLEPSPAQSDAAPAPQIPAQLLPLRQTVQKALADHDDAIEQLMDHWVAHRDSFPASTQDEWAARSYLDRISVGGGDEARGARARDAVEAARRSGDETLLLRAQATVASLDHADDPRMLWSTAQEYADDLLARGAFQEAAGVWSTVARILAGTSEGVQAARHAANAAARGGDSDSALLVLTAAAQDTLEQPAVSEELIAQAKEYLTPDSDPVARGRLSMIEAQSYEDRERPQAQVDLLREAVTQYSQANHMSGHAAALAYLIEILSGEERYPEAQDHAQELIQLGRSRHAPAVVGLGQCLLARVYHDTGRAMQALELLETALPVLRETQYPSLLDVLSQYGSILAESGEYDAGAAALIEAAELAQQREEPGLVATCLFRVGALQTEASRYEEAAATFRRSAHWAHLAGNVPTFTQARAEEADALALNDATDAALAILQQLPAEVAPIQERDDVHLTVHEGTFGVGLKRQAARICSWDDRDDDAVRLLQEALTLLDDLPDDEVVNDAYRQEVSLEYAWLLATAGRAPEAEPLARQILAAPADEEARDNAIHLLARILDETGRTQEAEQVWEMLSDGS